MDHTDTGPAAEELPPESPPRQIGIEAEALDREQTVRQRMRLPRDALGRIVALLALYTAVLVALLTGVGTAGAGLELIPAVVAVTFVLETTDSAAGMGFGTGLAPLLFILGYDPLQVIPPLLVSETLTGVIAGFVHHDVDNVTFSVRPLNTETRLLGSLAGVGLLGVVAAVTLTYYAFELPDILIESYVSVLVLAMGAVGLLRAKLKTRIEYRPRRLVAFAVLAGINKGIGGGGYGPVVTLGQILSGVYEKSAVAITTLAEGVVSIGGVVTFLVLAARGVPVDFVLLPSVLTGGVLAAVVAPYLVRILPNEIWRYAIPVYAFGIGLTGLALGLDI